MRMQVEPVAEAVVMEVEDQVTATGTAPLVDKDLVAQLVGDAQRLGLSVEGEGGLLAQLTKLVLESALEGEMTAHLGYDKHERVEGSENARNGTRSKTVLTKAGPVEIAVPRDRAGSFEPVVVAKRQRRLGAIEDVVLSLSARGLTHGDISAHLADVYGSEVSKTTISTITDKVLDGMTAWQNRPLDPVYPVVFIDAIHVKVRDGQVANRPIYVALAVTSEGNRDILGLWCGDCRRRLNTDPQTSGKSDPFRPLLEGDQYGRLGGDPPVASGGGRADQGDRSSSWDCAEHGALGARVGRPAEVSAPG